MSHAMATLTATAARNGDPIASTPEIISKTPHRMDPVEACRTMAAAESCAIETSSIETFFASREKPENCTPFHWKVLEEKRNVALATRPGILKRVAFQSARRLAPI